jgi:hypothetical protein
MKSKELKKLDRFIANTKKETKALNMPKKEKRYKMTCQASCKFGWSVSSTYTVKGTNKRLMKKKLLKDIKDSYPERFKCKIKRNSINVEEI